MWVADERSPSGVRPLVNGLRGPQATARLHNGLTMQHSHCADSIYDDQIEVHAKPQPARELMAIAKKVAKPAWHELFGVSCRQRKRSTATQPTIP